MNTDEAGALQGWLGRQESRTELITAAPVAGLSAALDYDLSLAGAGQPLPAAWHWLYFLPVAPASALDVDGHPRRGGFLPPVSLPRRMWAGSRLRWHSPVYIGDEIRRTSTISDIKHKRGGSGELVFVTVQHQLFNGEALALEEEQSLVYRPASVGSAAPPGRSAPARAHWSRPIQPDPVLLFRFSALTFNAHRIHYDRDYATRKEGYGGLVVQGPLTAILLLDLLRSELPGEQLGSFEFRGIRPLLDTAPMQLQGRREGSTVLLWALDDAGALAMEATVHLA